MRPIGPPPMSSCRRLSTSWTCTKTSEPPPSGTMKLDRLRRTLPRRQDRTIRLAVFRNLDGADAIEQISGDVVRHHLAERRQRPVGVGAAHGKTKCPGIDRRAAPGANDNLKFRVALRAPAQCRHVTGEGYLNFAGRLVAQERNRHIGEFKPAFVRAASGAPDELLLFLHRFLQGPGDRRDVEDRRLLDRHGIRRRLARLARLRPRRERPRGRRAAEQRDEVAPFHSITSSARASTVAGTSSPSALAVLRLTTSSYLVGACAGRSAGFSPLRMRST